MMLRTVVIAIILLAAIIMAACAGQTQVASAETIAVQALAPPADLDYTSPIPDTGQSICYDDSSVITCPTEGKAYFVNGEIGYLYQ